jgi:Flp pilus assembly protein TadD
MSFAGRKLVSTIIVPDAILTDLDRLVQRVRSEPNRGDMRYLLGAEWAAAGRYELAVAEMTRAVELDPTLYTAHLQLGLLHLTSGRPAEALTAWRGLDTLADTDPLRMFRRGLEALIGEDFATCVSWLESGILANQSNPALNRDMVTLVNRVRRPGPIAAQRGAAAADAGGVRTDFSLYDPKKT